MSSAAALLRRVRACTLCTEHLPLGPRPVFQLHPRARILIAAQAPGKRVHDTGVPFNDPSGERLRAWLGVTRQTFYDPLQIALLPMGFCFPGTGKSGDLPPRPECAAAWRAPLLGLLKNVQLTLVIGQYAMAYHLPRSSLTQPRGNLTQTVAAWRELGPALIPLPHPSPRNNRWLARNRWFEQELVPVLRERVAAALT